MKRQLFLPVIISAIWSISAGGCSVDTFSSPANGDNYYYSEDTSYTAPSTDDFYSQPDESLANNVSGSESDTEQVCDTVHNASYNVFPQKADATAGPTLARALIESKERVKFPIRVAEFLNYYRPDKWIESDRTEVSAELGIAVSAAATESVPAFDIFIGFAAPPVAESDRHPINMTILLDTSPTMTDEALRRAKDVSILLANEMGSQDTLALVIPEAETPRVEPDARDDIESILSTVEVDEDGDFDAGLSQAYAITKEKMREGAVNLVVLLSNGLLSIGITDRDTIADEASTGDATAIRFIAMGVASPPTEYDVAMMRALSEAGLGAHLFFDTVEEAENILSDKLSHLTEPFANDISFELTLPPAFVIEVPSDAAVAADAAPPNALLANGLITVFQQAIVCDPAAFNDNMNVSLSASYIDATGDESLTTNHSEQLSALLETASPSIAKTTAIVRYAETLKAVKTLSNQRAREAIAEAVDAMDEALTTTLSDRDLLEIRSLLEQYRDLF